MKRAARAILTATFAAASLFAITSNAHAASVASLTMHSDPGDFLGQGKDYSYSQPQDQFFANIGFNQSVIFGIVNGLNGDRWTVQLAAPDNQPLQVGTYLDAQGAPFQQPGHPGIQINGGFTCQTITGQFDVLDIEYTNGMLSRFDATFEEHCNGAAAALTGEFIFTPPSPPLPPLALNVNIDHTGTVNSADGSVTASGTVTCNQFVFTTVSVELNQGNGSNPAFGNVSVSCSPGITAKWAIIAFPFAPFHAGHAAGSAFAFGEDGSNGTEATSPTANSVVALIPVHG
jgi:hypothetical protein